MFFRKGLFFFFILLTLNGYAQTELSLKLGVSPWHFVSQFEDLSNPISLAYSGGLNFEQVLGKSSVGIAAGIEYVYSQPGTKYTDLSDQENLLAVIYEKEINEKYINVIHHEVSVPLMFVFYHNGMRTAIGAAYNRYLFENKLNSSGFDQYTDYGLKFCTGARLSKRLIFSIGYYYGLKQVINVNAIPESEIDGGAAFTANMQQLNVSLTFSIFNNYTDSKYFISPN